MFKKVSRQVNQSPRGHKRMTQISPDDEVALSDEAMARRDFNQAALHIGRALSFDANRQDWLDRLNAVIDSCPDLSMLAPLEGNNSASVIAVRAYVHGRQQDFSEAIGLLADVVPASPQSGYLEWLIAWFYLAGTDVAIDPEPVTRMLTKLASTLHHDFTELDEDRPGVDRLMSLVDVVSRNQEPNPEFTFAAMSLLRRLGYKYEMLGIAQSVFDTNPSFASACALAAAHQALGDSKNVRAAYSEALKFAPEDPAVRQAIADSYTADASQV
jgi:hypothetical protein